MGINIPRVLDGSVDDPGLAGGAIRLDTAAWMTWLEAPTTRSFSYPLYDEAHGYIDGFMTVRKETRQRGGMYWSVFRRCGGRLRKIYLGPSRMVTQGRLLTIAAALRVLPAAHEPPDTTAP